MSSNIQKESFSKKFPVIIAASLFAETATYPLDTIKTKLQLQGDIQQQATKGVYKSRSYLKTIVYISKNEGILTLFRGLPPALLRHVIYSGARMPLYEAIRDRVRDDKLNNQTKGKVYKKIPEGLSLPQAILIAGFCGSFGQFLASPTDLLKVRMQSGEYKSFYTAYKSVPNFKSFWRGSTPNVWRAFFVNQGDLMTYDQLKSFILNNPNTFYLTEGSLLHFVCSFGAGLIACSLALPFDTVKTRIMNQQKQTSGIMNQQQFQYKNMMHAFRLMIVNEGIFSLYRGFFAAWPRMALWSQCFWHANENIRKFLDMKPF